MIILQLGHRLAAVLQRAGFLSRTGAWQGNTSVLLLHVFPQCLLGLQPIVTNYTLHLLAPPVLVLHVSPHVFDLLSTNITGSVVVKVDCPDVPGHNVLLTKSLVAMRTGVAFVLSGQWSPQSTSPRLLDPFFFTQVFVSSIRVLHSKGILKRNEVDGVFDNCCAFELHKVVHAQAGGHLLTLLHPQVPTVS